MTWSIEKLNDRTAIYNNLPFEVPNIGQSGTINDPVYINPNTVQPIGINFQNGTLLSPTNRYVTQVDGNGQTNLSFEIPWIVQSKLRSSTEDLKIQKNFNLFGSHHLTFGGYHSNDDDSHNFRASPAISTLANPAQLVDVYRGRSAQFQFLAPDGSGNRGVARPLFGKTERATVNYRF